jgi:hypothetical protein
MTNVTKGLRCCCGHEQNVQVAETVLGIFCPKCKAWVWLGEALGLTTGQAIVAALILWGSFG